jgi:Fe-S-cluster containining protein
MSFNCLVNCGKCCVVVPMNKEIFEKHAGDVQEQPYKVLELSMGIVIPMTKTMRCCFLTKEKTCAIYPDRPIICQDFGIRNKHPCPYLTPEGNMRTKAKTKKLEEQTRKRIDLIKEELERGMTAWNQKK